VLVIMSFAAGTGVGSGFHLRDLPMESVPALIRPLLNAFFHFSYVWMVVFLFAGFGRIVFKHLKKRTGRAHRVLQHDLEAGSLGGTDV